ncbi:MAG: potassium channel family protein [Negativibacillus sp.]
MNILIVGCGKVGADLASTLYREGHDVAVIDRNPDNFHRLDNDFSGLILQGLAIDQDVLRQAGIEDCDALAAVSEDDNTNIMVCEIATQVFHVSKAVARVYDPSRENIFSRFGVRAMSPTSLTSSTIRFMLLDEQPPQQIHFDNSMLNFSLVPVSARWAGHSLRDIALHNSSTELYLGVLDASGRIILSGNEDYTLQESDRLILTTVLK